MSSTSSSRIIALSLISGVLACAQTAQPVVAGYYQESSSFPLTKLVSNGSLARLTHLNYAFAEIRQVANQNLNAAPGYTCAVHDPAGELGSNGVFQQLKSLKAANPKLKVLISVGGQADSYNFSSAANDANRVNFVQSCINVFIDGQFASPKVAGVFDGIDVDWEFPLTSSDATAYNLLLQEFRLQLNNYQQSHPSVQPLILTSAISPQNGPDKLQNITFSGNSGAAAYVDFFNVMTYDYAGTWNERTSSTAPLSAITSNVTDLVTLSRIPASKIVVGIPFYGVHYTGSFSGDTNGTPLSVLLSHSSVNPVLNGDQSTQSTDYSAISRNVLNAQNGVSIYHDGDSSAWAFDSRNSLLWSYDDETTIAAKAAYAHNSGFAGIMTWDISKDTDGGTLLCAMETAVSGGNTSACAAGPVSNPTPNPGTLLFDFENAGDVQGWVRTGGVFSVDSSSDRFNTGSRSLALHFINYRQTYQKNGTVYATPPAAVAAGSTVDFHLWVPANAFQNLSAITPFFMDKNWAWTSTAVAMSSLTPNAWNTISVHVPANAVGTFTEIGIQFDINNLWNGILYLDTVTVR